MDSERFTRLEKKLQEHDNRFDEHDKRFDAIDKRLDEHDKRFDAIDKKLLHHEHRLEALTSKTPRSSKAEWRGSRPPSSARVADQKHERPARWTRDRALVKRRSPRLTRRRACSAHLKLAAAKSQFANLSRKVSTYFARRFR